MDCHGQPRQRSMCTVDACVDVLKTCGGDVWKWEGRRGREAGRQLSLCTVLDDDDQFGGRRRVQWTRPGRRDDPDVRADARFPSRPLAMYTVDVTLVHRRTVRRRQFTRVGVGGSFEIIPPTRATST